MPYLTDTELVVIQERETALRAERDRYKDECDKYRALLNGFEPPGELLEMQAERDAVRQELQDYRDLGTCHDLSMLKAERDAALEEVKDWREKWAGTESARNTELLKERDAALAEIEQLKSSRDYHQVRAEKAEARHDVSFTNVGSKAWDDLQAQLKDAEAVIKEYARWFPNDAAYMAYRARYPREDKIPEGYDGRWCRFCGADIPPRDGEGTCQHCDPPVIG